MLLAAWEMREVIKSFCNQASNGLVAYILSDKEWESVLDLILKDATLYFSSNNPPVLSVIPAMDRIDKIFATTAAVKSTSSKRSFSPPMHYALAIGKKMMNKYYALSDNSYIYCISMVLHPSHKLAYFQRLGWDNKWITKAVNITQEVWCRGFPPFISLFPYFGSSAQHWYPDRSADCLYLVGTPVPSSSS
ncbi:hypothetical protein CYLTODRAFT_363564 [Cylindrobasidium torrendii FP15055 ss-10]|uniref:hAT-like transposase RNase-H fold domain-containing protein n=1 Tax=Cylindrobasidium torrendii FP15055 ss-10 TaxID=1314674 RepID=A0A0D7AUG4_9AGAR|nr:hypothetical protein CYLTODRAFT_363564 [Cylindrobasidium torrendii FP15055 ss-10]